MTVLSPEAIKILPILESLPKEEKLQLFSRVMGNHLSEKKEDKETLTVAEFIKEMEQFDFPKDKILSVEEMDEGIAKMFENREY